MSLRSVARTVAALLVIPAAAVPLTLSASPAEANAKYCQIKEDVGTHRLCAIDKVVGKVEVKGHFDWYFKDGGPNALTGSADFTLMNNGKPGCAWSNLTSHDYTTGQTYRIWQSTCGKPYSSYSYDLGGDVPRHGYFLVQVCTRKNLDTCKQVWKQGTAEKDPTP